MGEIHITSILQFFLNVPKNSFTIFKILLTLGIPRSLRVIFRKCLRGAVTQCNTAENLLGIYCFLYFKFGQNMLNTRGSMREGSCTTVFKEVSFPLCVPVHTHWFLALVCLFNFRDRPHVKRDFLTPLNELKVVKSRLCRRNTVKNWNES